MAQHYCARLARVGLLSIWRCLYAHWIRAVSTASWLLHGKFAFGALKTPLDQCVYFFHATKLSLKAYLKYWYSKKSTKSVLCFNSICVSWKTMLRNCSKKCVFLHQCIVKESVCHIVFPCKTLTASFKILVK